jgi:nucleotide-binding universal stress UspA family protein
VRIARIVCGIEPGGHGVGAAARAARIAPDDAPLVLVGAADIGAAAMAQPLGGDIDMGPMPAGPWTSLEDLEAAVREDLERAERALAGRAGVATRIEVGSLASALEEVAGAGEGVLLALDAPQEGRMLGIIDADPGTWLMHESSRPLFLSRGPEDPGDFPRLVVAGVDGSAPSAVAAEAAGDIARRGGAELRLVVARGGRGADRDAVEKLRARLPAHELVEDRRSPVHALTDAGGDLIVVGSRGLHGIRALGSVSERVVHGAEGSVLVAR